MLYTELSSIYEKKDYLNKIKPFEELHYMLKKFLVTELKKQTVYFNPYKFAYINTMNHKAALNFFLAVSYTESVFKPYYSVECDCGSTNIVEELSPEIIMFCDECLDEIQLYENSYLKNVNVLFKLNSNIKKEINLDLKLQSSSEETNLSGEDISIGEPSLGDIMDSQDEELKEISAFSIKFAKELRYALNGV